MLTYQTKRLALDKFHAFTVISIVNFIRGDLFFSVHSHFGVENNSIEVKLKLFITEIDKTS
jgi:hypothetical protein